MIDQTATVQYKSKQFAIRIVRLYQYLCNEKRNLFFPSNSFEAAQVSEPISAKANVPSARKNSLQKCILHSKNPTKLYIGLTFFTIQIIYLKVSIFLFTQIVKNSIKCLHLSQNQPVIGFRFFMPNA